MPSNILSIFLVKLLISFCAFCICIFFRQSKKFGNKHFDVKIMERIFITFWNNVLKLEWGFPLLKIDQSYIFWMLCNVYITGNYWYRSITTMSKLTKKSLEGLGSYSGTSRGITKIKKKYYKYQKRSIDIFYKYLYKSLDVYNSSSKIS